jgi:hypothetical protein
MDFSLLADAFGRHLNRDSFFVPSMKCQSLLGKAIQEHFKYPERVACVFSSSPSLQNSSAGANFLTNFKLDEKSITLFRTVFTPEDCFSVSFAPSIHIDSEKNPGRKRPLQNALSFFNNSQKQNI